MRIQRRKFTRIQTNLQIKEQNAESGSVSRSGYISGGGVLGLPCFPRDGETKERHLNKGICQQCSSNTLASPWPAKLHPITCKYQPGTVGMAGKGMIGCMTCFPKAGSSLETTHGSVSSLCKNVTGLLPISVSGRRPINRVPTNHSGRAVPD